MTTLSHCHKGNLDSKLYSSTTVCSYNNNNNDFLICGEQVTSCVNSLLLLIEYTCLLIMFSSIDATMVVLCN